MASVQLDYGTATHPGTRRRRNEDAVLACENVFVVADGVGGRSSGGVASAIAIDVFTELIGRADIGVRDVEAAAHRANDALRVHGMKDARRAGLATTSTVLALSAPANPSWIVANIGDSRVYRLGASQLEQVTVDHSEVAELIYAGQLTSQQAEQYPRRNVLTRALGARPSAEIDTWTLPVRAGDQFVLCSDGLTNEVPESAIAATVRHAAAPQDAADLLVRAAIDAGGHDNISVVVVAVGD